MVQFKIFQWKIELKIEYSLKLIFTQFHKKVYIKNCLIQNSVIKNNNRGDF
jgi:hypothetical protein